MGDRFDLFDPQCRAVLCDMGTAIDLPDNEHLSDQVGTKLYWAPEVIDKKYSFPVDVWALGITLYGSVCGCFPFATLNHTVRKNPNLSSKDLSKPCIDFLTALLHKDPTVRPTVDKTLELEW